MIASVNMSGRWKACKGLRLVWEGSADVFMGQTGTEWAYWELGCVEEVGRIALWQGSWDQPPAGLKMQLDCAVM